MKGYTNMVMPRILIFVFVMMAGAIGAQDLVSLKGNSSYTLMEQFDAGSTWSNRTTVTPSIRRLTKNSTVTYHLLLVRDAVRPTPERRVLLEYQEVVALRDAIRAMNAEPVPKAAYWEMKYAIGEIIVTRYLSSSSSIPKWGIDFSPAYKDSYVFWETLDELLPHIDEAIAKMQALMKE